MARCYTCDRHFHSLGIARHRAMHRDKKEKCDIETQEGRFEYDYSQPRKATIEQQENRNG